MTYYITLYVSGHVSSKLKSLNRHRLPDQAELFHNYNGITTYNRVFIFKATASEKVSNLIRYCHIC